MANEGASDGEAFPIQRKAPVRLFTDSGWMTGTLHVPEKEPLLDFLNSDRTFFTLTEVALQHGAKLPFLALARNAILLIEPTEEELVESIGRTSTRTKLRQVSALFQGGMIMGTLALPADSRVSDEVMAASGFLVVGNCTIGLDAPDGPPAMEAALTVLVSAARLIGVAEMTGS